MNKHDIVSIILKNKTSEVLNHTVQAYAPANIALVKYWGKRNAELNLPVTSSLSVSLGNYGTEVKISLSKEDQLIINQQRIASDSKIMLRLQEFLDLFRQRQHQHLKLECTSNIPIAAGLASSSAAFAAVVLALNDLYQWQLPLDKLSILARLGSGSACRSLWHGFVKWQKGKRKDGMDSYAIPIKNIWPGLCIGLVICDAQPKSISSRAAMEITKQTASCYRLWPEHNKNAMHAVEEAIAKQDFELLGTTAEHNALTMHASMLMAKPAICYFSPRTIEIFHKIWELRAKGLAVYFTQDAGANVKLLFQQRDSDYLQKLFPEMKVITPFTHYHNG